MTREEIERLQWRQLDAAVHEQVFGRPVRWATQKVSINGDEWLPLRRVPCDPDEGEVPRYSIRLDEAWIVIEAMAHRGYELDVKELTMSPYGDAPYTCLSFGRSRADHARNLYSYAGPLATAICRAALIALAGEEEQK